MKKVFAILLTVVLMMALATTAFAASITIDPQLPTDTTDGAETYTAYKIFDAKYVDGAIADDLPNGANISYTIDSSSPYFTAIQNFTTGDPAKSVFKLDKVNDTTTYIVTKLESYEAADLAAALKGITATGTTGGYSTDGKYTISGLDKGYYLITSTLGSKMIVDTLGNVSINTKNQYPSLEKNIVTAEGLKDKITADRGNVITFEIDVAIPATAAGAITVHDQMNADLIYVADSETAMVGDAAITSGFSKTAADESSNACTFHFVLSAECVAANLGKTVKITYQATLDSDAPLDTAIKNTAWLTYSGFVSVPDEVEVYTFQINVFKYTGDSENKVGLAGAGFVLKNSAGQYYKNTNGNVTWVDTEAEATEYVTAADSYTISFAGLKNGTYTLHEKTVPTGYNPAQDVTNIVIEDKSCDKVGEVNPTHADQIEVLNQTGVELPQTGGIGTRIFYIAGSVLMLGAIVVFVARKKVSSNED